MFLVELIILFKNYFLWLLCGWLFCKMVGLEFIEVVVLFDEKNCKELLFFLFFVLVLWLMYGVVIVWDMLVIVEYMYEWNL